MRNIITTKSLLNWRMFMMKKNIKNHKHTRKKMRCFRRSTSLFSLTLTLFFFFLDGFKYVDDFARNFTESPILVALIFFGVIRWIGGSDLLTTPFSYYKTFVIEESFGFNKSTKALFWIDKIKGLVMSSFLGGGILALTYCSFIKFLEKISGCMPGF